VVFKDRKESPDKTKIVFKEPEPPADKTPDFVDD